MRMRALSLLLLCCVSFSQQDASQIVACRNEEKLYGGYSKYVRNATSGQFVAYHQFSHLPCDEPNMGMFCRKAYNGMFYAVNLNKTVEFESIVRWVHSQNVPESLEMLTASQFECKVPLAPAKELSVPDGSWDDKLQSPRCLPEDIWLAEAERKCGKKPTNYSLGARCGDIQGYLEMIFVCNTPLSVAPIQETIRQLKQDAQFRILESYAKTAHQLMQADQNDVVLVERLTRELQRIRDSNSNLILRMEMPYMTKTLHSRYLMQQVISRRLALNAENLNMEKSTINRRLALFNLAQYLLSNGTLENPLNFDAAENKMHVSEMMQQFNAENFFMGKQESFGSFPENEAELREYYIEYCKNNTLGIAVEHLDFLSEPNAHVRLIEMYEEIFNPGLINPKYLPKYRYFDVSRVQTLTVDRAF